MKSPPAATSSRPILSVVVPCFNERENIPTMLARVVAVVEPLTEGSFEVIFVNDGSTDGSTQLLRSLHESYPPVKVINFSRNFGHQPALSAGLAEARGEAVVLIDGDLQDPPELITTFVKEWRNGNDVVYAVRQNRKEGVHKRLAYAAFYRSMRWLSDIDVPLDAGDFCLMDRQVVDALVELPERNRFLRGLRAWVGFKHLGIPYDRDARLNGEPKYTLRQLLRLALSGYVGFSTLPLRFATYMGLFATFVGLCLAVWAVAQRLMGDPTPWGWASTVSINLFIGGIQLLMLGIVSEYIGRIYDEVRRRPLYVARERLGLDNEIAADLRAHSSNADSLRV